MYKIKSEFLFYIENTLNSDWPQFKYSIVICSLWLACEQLTLSR